jgi:mycothiol synthase
MSSSPPEPELRPPTLADLPVLADFFADIEATYGAGGLPEGDVRDLLTNPHLDVEQNFRIALSDGGVVGWVDIWDQNSEHERLFVDVRARRREPEVYVPLLDWAERRGRAIALGRAAVLRAGRVSDDEALEDELETRGFGLIRHFFRMEIDLADEPEPPAWPEGIAVRTLREGEEHAIFEAASESFSDHWDYHPMAFDEWRSFFVESSAFDPTLWFVAEEDGEIAGFAICRWERRPNTSHVAVLGVRRAWRRRGLGTALLLHAFAEFRRRGRAKADLGVDAENLTGAVRLYERAGMRVATRFDAYEKRLPPQA